MTGRARSSGATCGSGRGRADPARRGRGDELHEHAVHATDERGSVVALAGCGGNRLSMQTYDEQGIPGAANAGGRRWRAVRVHGADVNTGTGSVVLQSPDVLAHAWPVLADRPDRLCRRGELVRLCRRECG